MAGNEAALRAAEIAAQKNAANKGADRRNQKIDKAIQNQNNRK